MMPIKPSIVLQDGAIELEWDDTLYMPFRVYRGEFVEIKELPEGEIQIVCANTAHNEMWINALAERFKFKVEKTIEKSPLNLEFFGGPNAVFNVRLQDVSVSSKLPLS